MAEIFHEIRTAGRKFTQEQWGDYCNRSRNNPDELIHTTIGKYVWNDNDICLNPESVNLEVKQASIGWYAHIRYADCGNGLWSFGISYGTGNGGGSYGVSFADKDKGKGWRRGYHTKDECLVAACDELLERFATVYDRDRNDNYRKLVSMVQDYKRSIGRPKVVQLELF